MQTLLTTAPAREEWQLDEDGERKATHPDAYLVPPCCTSPDSDGLWSCGCGGQTSVVCPAVDCPGIADHEVEELITRLEGGNRERRYL
jgi:hypothetical protein